MVKAKMRGHVEEIDTSGNYDNSFVLTDEQQKDTKYVNHVKFTVSSKKTELMDQISVGDEIEVTFYVTGMKGESKKTGKPYQINKLMVGEITVIKKADKPKESQPEVVDDPDNVPF